MMTKANHFPVWLMVLSTVGLLCGGCSRKSSSEDDSGDRENSTEIEETDTSSSEESDPLEDTENRGDSASNSASQDTDGNKELDTDSDTVDERDRDTGVVEDTDTGKPTVITTDTHSEWHPGDDTDTAVDTTPLDVQCNDYSPEAIFQRNGKIADLNVADDTMVVALGREGLAIYDISGDAAVLLSRVDTGGNAVALAMAPGYAYVLHKTTGLSVVHMEDANSPEVVGRTGLIEGGVAVSWTGDVVAVLSVRGVALFDVTDTTAPTPLGTLDMPDGMAMHAVDDTLYVGDAKGNIRAVSISDPMHPTVDKSAFITGGEVRALFAEDDIHYALNRDLLQVLDMDEPTSSCVASKTDVRGSPSDLHVADHTAYVLMNDASSVLPDYNASWAVSVVDVSDPGAPTVLGDSYCRKTTKRNKMFGTDSDLYIFTEDDVTTVPLDAAISFPVVSVTSMGQSECTPVGMTDELLFTFCNRLESHADLTVFRTDGNAPEAIGALLLPDTVDMRVSEDFHYAYVLTREAGLYVVDVSTPTAPTIVSVLELAGVATMLTVSYGKAAVLMEDEYYLNIMWLLDLSDPAAPTVALDDPLPPGWSVQSVLLHDDLLYASETTDQDNTLLTITDVTDLTTPVHMDALPITASLSQLILNDGYLFGRTHNLFVFDVSIPGNPVEVSSLQLPTQVQGDRRMGLSNDRLYLLGNTIVDISNPAVPAIATYSPSASISYQRTILVSGNRAAVSGEEPSSVDVIALYDLSDPDQPETIGEITTLETAVDLDVLDGTAYLLHLTSLESLDVSDPDNPTRLNRLALPFTARDMARFDHMLYLAGEGWGLQIIDISSPAAPVLRGRVDVSSVNGFGVRLTADETHVYMADSPSGLQVINVTDPDVPFVETTEPEVSGDIRDIEKQGDTLYLASRDGWFVVDVTNPGEPTILYQSAHDQFVWMVLADHLIYLRDSSNGIVYDVSDPASPVLVGTIPISYDWHGAGPLLRYGDMLLSAQHPIEMFDISDPAAPRLAGHLPFSSTGRMVGAVADDMAYFATDDLVIVDLSRLSSSRRVEPILSLQAANRVAWFDDKAVILEDDALSLLDVSTPESPRELGRIPIQGVRLEVSDGLAFVSDYYEVHMVDITSASAPRPVGRLITDGSSWVHFVEKIGNIGYVITKDLRLASYDLSDMFAPSLLDTLEIPEISEGVVKGDRMYVAGFSELTVVDISNAEALRIITTLDLPYGTKTGMSIEGDILALTSPLMIFDISDPDAPVLRGQHHSYYFNSVSLKSGVAYVADGTYELTLFNVVTQAPPTMVGQFRPPDNISDVAFDDTGHAYLVDQAGGLGIWNSSSFVTPPVRSHTLIESNVVDIEKQGDMLFALPGFGRVQVGNATTDVRDGFTQFSQSEIGGLDISLDGHLYVLDYEGVVRVFDVADPAALPIAEVGFDMADPPTHLLARGGLVLALNRSGNIGVIEKTPTNLSVRSEYRLSAYSGAYSDMEPCAYQSITSEVELWDQKAAVVSSCSYESGGNLTVLDLHDPGSPVELSSIDSYGVPTSVAMHGSHLFVGISTSDSSPTGMASEILVWDLTDPAQPVLVSAIPSEGATAMSAEGNRLVVGERSNEISVFDISDPTAPTPIIRIPTPSIARKIAWDAHRVFAVAQYGILLSIRVDDCVEWRETLSY